MVHSVWVEHRQKGRRADLVLATGNRHKALEIERWFRHRGLKIAVDTAEAYGGMDGCREDAGSFEGNASCKALFLRPRVPTEIPVLADDSGLEVDALDGAPGVLSARFAGDDADDRANRELLLERMRFIRSPRKRAARFVCVLALAHGEGRRAVRSFRGECEGVILFRPKGNGGFGYDPVFAPTGCDRSFAELSPEEKDGISHRGKALEMLEKVLTVPPIADCLHRFPNGKEGP